MTTGNFTRRDFLASAIGGAAILTTTSNPGAAQSRKPSFLQSGKVRGIDAVPPGSNWNARRYGLGRKRVDALVSAGFNTLRLFVPYEEFISASKAGPSVLRASVTRWTNYARLGARAGFRVIVCWGDTYEDRLATIGDPERTKRFSDVLAALAEGLVAAFDPGQVCVEIMNEPPSEKELADKGYPSWSRQVSPALFQRLREAAPSMTAVIQSAGGGWSETIPDLPYREFDADTIFCFHFYTPGEFTHQGANYKEFHDIPFPITRYEGGRQKMEADVIARVMSRNEMSADEKDRLIAHDRDVLDYLWQASGPLGPSWVKWPKLDAWIAENNVNPEQILCGEFGVVSNFNFNGMRGTDVTSRANYIRAVREAVEARGFAGWVVHQAFGDFNVFQQNSITDHGDALIPEVREALFS